MDELERRRFIDRGDAAVLRKAWCMCTAARNGNYLWNGRVSQADILPDDMYSLGGIAVYLGYDAHRGQHFENDLLAVMRKAATWQSICSMGAERDGACVVNAR